MSAQAPLLERIHGLRLPPPPSLPDNAPDIWPLVALGFAALVLALALAWWLRRPAAQVVLLLEQARALPPDDRLAAYAVLLRRLCLAQDAKVSGLSGQPWLEALDRRFATDFFTRRGGGIFGEALYQRSAGADLEALHRDLARLVRRGGGHAISG